MKRLTGNSFRSLPRRRLTACVVAVALALLALIPAGFMPTFAGGGKVAIVICSGAGEKTILVDARDAPAGDHGASQTCPYFLAQSPVVAGVPVIIAAPPAFDVVTFLPLLRDLPDGVRILPPPARGPPAVTAV